MQGIIIETSTNRSTLILARDGLPISTHSLPEGPELSKILGQAVASLLNRQRSDFVAIGIGPGSYTGIRVGAAMAQSLAYGWQVPLLPFCSLSAFTPPIDPPFAVLVDARIGGFYCLKSGGQATLLSLDQAYGQLSSLPLFSPHPELVQKRLRLPVRPAEVNSPSLAAFCCKQEGRSPLDPLPLTYLS